MNNKGVCRTAPATPGKVSVYENKLYFECKRTYYNGSVRENTNLYVFCGICTSPMLKILVS